MKHTPTFNEIDEFYAEAYPNLKALLAVPNNLLTDNSELIENKIAEIRAKVDEWLHASLGKGSIQLIRSYDIQFEYNKRVRRLEINARVGRLDSEPARKLPQAPALKKLPVLRVGDEIEWCFYVNGYKETSSSVVIKRLDEKACLMRDGFIVDELKVKSHTGQIAGQLLSVKRADILNGGKKSIY